MGTDYRAKYILGWKVIFEEVYEPITKYNQDTGEPYTVEQFSHRDAYINGVFVNTINHSDEEVWECPDEVVGVHYICDEIFVGICYSVGVGDNPRFKDVTEVDVPHQLIELIDRFGECDNYFGLDIS